MCFSERSDRDWLTDRPVLVGVRPFHSGIEHHRAVQKKPGRQGLAKRFQFLQTWRGFKPQRDVMRCLVSMSFPVSESLGLSFFRGLDQEE